MMTAVCISSVGRKVDAEEAVQEKDRITVQHTILRYTQLLAQGYANMNMTNLQEVATEEQALKAYRHMSALGDAKIRMESHLEDIEFVDIQLPKEGSARVRTRERWNYVHVKTGAQIPAETGVQGLVYNLSYELARNDGRWLVSSISVLDTGGNVVDPSDP